MEAVSEGGGVDEVTVAQTAHDELIELFQSWSVSSVRVGRWLCVLHAQ